MGKSNKKQVFETAIKYAGRLLNLFTNTKVHFQPQGKKFLQQKIVLHQKILNMAKCKQQENTILHVFTN